GIVLPSLFGKRAPEMQVPVPVIDDWAQYLPAAPVHKSPAIAIVSFGGTKPITAGEGGAILVNDPGLAERLRQQKRLTGGASGLNLYPFSDLQAALALSQLGRKDEMALRRRAHADAYAEALADMRGLSFASPASADVPYRLPIRLSDELLARTGGIEALIRKMAKRGIAVRRPVAVLLHHVRPQARPLPVADDLFARTISLPLYPSLVPEQRHAVIVALREVLA
ncbi:MAG: DegT/DnrJ/EryC1/StrS family aminotransferase, partial [Alphaproteobacteria bacterium]